VEEPINILCVDDEKNVLRAIRRMFLEEEYSIHTATTREEGIEILQRVSPIQIVISDYRMPGTNGIDFLRDVCRNWPDTVRIVLSGFADMAAVVSAINEGQIYKFVPKPWNDDELRIAIWNALERYFLAKKNLMLTEALKRKNRELEAINQNLEKMVEERTVELQFQNRVLTHSQNILDTLPVGVVGIEPDGMIVQCNRQGSKWLTGDGTSPIGRHPGQLGCGDLDEIIDRAQEKGACSDRTLLHGRNVDVRAVFMDHSNGQRGVILVLDGEDRDD
jgi:two-component system NtrC family sensor kinase